MKPRKLFSPLLTAAVSIAGLCILLGALLGGMKLREYYRAQQLRENSILVVSEEESKGNEHLLERGGGYMLLEDEEELPSWWKGERKRVGEGESVLVDVTAEMKGLVEEYMKSSCVNRSFSKNSITRYDTSEEESKSAFSLSNLVEDGKPRKRRIEVEKVVQVSNLKLWKEYKFRRETIRRSIREIEIGEKLRARQVSWELEEVLEIDESCNESLLIHGTDKRTAQILVRQGFDHRVGRLNGRYGAGCYFAEDFQKSRRYMRKDAGGRRYLLLTRVCMGVPFVAGTEMKWARRPPTVGASGRMADSVIGVADERYREFIVYDNRQCIPELLVTLKS